MIEACGTPRQARSTAFARSVLEEGGNTAHLFAPTHLSSHLHRLQPVHQLRDDWHIEILEERKRPQEFSMRVKRQFYPQCVRQIPEH